MEIPHTNGLGDLDNEVRKIELFPEVLAKYEALANNL